MSSAVLEASDLQLTIDRLNPTIGAEVGGVDLTRPLSAQLREQLRELLLKHKVLFFRDQDITRDQQVAFALNFGELYAHPTGGVETHRVVQPIAAENIKKYTASNESHWHTDTSWRIDPSFGAVLRAVTIPEVGGDTIWADGAAIYRGLPEDLKARIDDLYVIHDYQDALRRSGVKYPLVAHPIVRTHPETGEDIFWVNFGLKPRIVDLDKAESDALLARLYEEVKRPEYHARFRWRKNSVAFWDNRAGLHFAVRDYGDFPRVMERVLIASDDIPYRVRR
ncbi:MAG: taurine catabolism dioxygenase TauD [Phenylobacterium sp.]|uniref:TauD/TfdA dioxygenase family protein n=1 Tax=Phenylobacterium sp. TaxID=1871053 RepID=UPI0025CC980D|nr:TauD/TfdA family dioxygenase [Phenylobacterium sp.]MBA4010300.1 taurine catabolism dioxygenase TauD [Phenylobacterium sp.]